MRVLLDRYIDGILSLEEKAELEQMLLANAGAREEFWDHAAWNAILREHGVRSWGYESADASLKSMPERQTHRLSRVLWFSSAAAIVLLATLIGLSVFSSHPLPSAVANTHVSPEGPTLLASDEATSDGVAVLTQTVDAVWDDTGAPNKVGSTLNTGTLKLRSGLAQIEFFCGGAVVLEGPAEFKLTSPREAYLVSGKVRVHVTTQAQGFRIRSATTDVVDWGTEFGMQIGTVGADTGTGLRWKSGIVRPGRSPSESTQIDVEQGARGPIGSRRNCRQHRRNA